MSSFALRRLFCLAALPLSIALVAACDDDTDETPSQSVAGAAGIAGAAGVAGATTSPGYDSAGSGGQFTGNGNMDGSNQPPEVSGGGPSGVGGSFPMPVPGGAGGSS